MIPLLAALMLQAAAHAAAEQPRLDASASPRKCTDRRARSVTIQAIMADPSGFDGKCVTVSALTDGKELFATEEALPPGWKEQENLPVSRQKLLNRFVASGGRRVVATGVVIHCGDARASMTAMAPPGTVVMMGGICHMTDGPALFLNSVRAERPSRRSGH